MTEKKESKPKATEKPAPKAEQKDEPKAASKAPAKAPPAKESQAKPADKKASEPTEAKKPVEAKKPAEPKQPAAKKEPAAKDDVTIVEEGEEEEIYAVKIKPELDAATRKALSQRAEIDGRRPAFRRQQWFEYKRLERSGWRKPTGQDSGQRRHFGYRPPIVSIGYRGPAAARGLHSSGFEEVRVERVADLESINPKKQAARISATVGRRKLEAIYAEADKRKIRVLNRRSI